MRLPGAAHPQRLSTYVSLIELGPGTGFEKLAKHELKDSAVPIVLELHGGIDSRERLEGLFGAVRSARADVETLPRREPARDAGDREHLFTGEAQALAILPLK